MKKSLLTLITLLCMLISCISVFGVSASAAPSTPNLITPYNGQILPWHDVILRWHQVTGEEYFLLDMRNISNGVSVYENLRISKDSTSVTIPKSKLVNGAHYRWFLRAVDANGNKANAEIRVFRTEYGRDSQGTDSHLWGTTYATASHIDYFISTPNSTNDGIMQAAVNSWNGISSNVYLHRDYNNVVKELGIYESSNPPNSTVYGRTYPGGSAYFEIGQDDPYDTSTVTFTEILIYYSNFENTSHTDFLRKVMLHETGHALALAHTDGTDYGLSPHVPINNRIDIVDMSMEGVTYYIYTLVMNNDNNISPEITDVDKAHLKIKWGN